MRQVIESAADSGDGVSIEREPPSTASELMATLNSPSLALNSPVSSVRINTAKFVHNSSRINTQLSSSPKQTLKRWLEQQWKEQKEEAAEKEAAEQAAAAQAAAEEEAAAAQAAAEEAALDAQKQAYKANADFIFEADPIDSGSHLLYKLEGAWSANMFVDVTGEVNATLNGQPFGFGIVTGLGDDVIYLGNNEDYFESAASLQSDSANGNDGDDKIFAGAGHQAGYGGHGNDLIDLGDGFDVARGSYGADEFVIDLQNSDYDLITDFLDVGDKITLLNGGEPAQQSDWKLVSVGKQWTGLNVTNNGSLSGVYLDHHNFYELQSADGQVAAIFSAGTMTGSVLCSNQQYDLTVQQSASGLEIVAQSIADAASINFI